jgi:hypothetical protein
MRNASYTPPPSRLSLAPNISPPRLPTLDPGRRNRIPVRKRIVLVLILVVVLLIIRRFLPSRCWRREGSSNRLLRRRTGRRSRSRRLGRRGIDAQSRHAGRGWRGGAAGWGGGVFAFCPLGCHWVVVSGVEGREGSREIIRSKVRSQRRRERVGTDRERVGTDRERVGRDSRR